MADYTGKLLSGSYITFIGLSIAAVLSYVLRIILARILPVEDVGLFFSVLNFIVFVSLFQRLGTEVALVRYINVWKVKEQWDNIRSGILGTIMYQLLAGIVCIALIILFADYLVISYFADPRARMILLLLSSLLILLIFEDIPRRIFQSFHKSFWFSFVEAFKALLFLVFVILGFGYATGGDVLVPTIAFLFSTVIVSVIGVIVSFRIIPFSGQKLSVDFPLFKKLFFFGLPLLFLVIGNKIIDSVDILILTYFRDLAEVGVYSVVLPTAAMLLFFFRPISVVLLPLVSELWERQECAYLAEMIRKLYYYLALLFIPLTILFILFAQELLLLLFGEVYAAGALSLQLILLGTFFFGLAHFNINFLTGVGQPAKAGYVMLWGAGGNLLLNILLIPSLGMEGAAIATMVSYFFTFFYSYYLLWPYLPVSFPRKQVFSLSVVLLLFVAVAVMFKSLVSSLLPQIPVILRIGVVGLSSLLVYLGVVYASGLLRWSEVKAMLLSMVRRKGD